MMPRWGEAQRVHRAADIIAMRHVADDFDPYGAEAEAMLATLSPELSTSLRNLRDAVAGDYAQRRMKCSDKR